MAETQTSSQDDEKKLLAQIFDNSLSNLAKIQLSGGVIGRMTSSIIYCAAFIAIAVIGAAFAGQTLLGVVGVISILSVYLFGVNNIRSHAHENPLTSMMEGAQLLLHQQIQQGMKSQPVISMGDDNPIIADPTQQLPVSNTLILDQPDGRASINQLPPASNLKNDSDREVL